MVLSDFDSEIAVLGPETVRQSFERTVGPERFAYVQLQDDDQEFPALYVELRGDLAYVHYLSNIDHPGFQAHGNLCGLDADGTTKFHMPGDWSEMPNETVVPKELALRAALEFFETRQLPTCISWREL